MYIDVHIDVHIDIDIHIDLHIDIHIHMYICIYVYVYTYIHTYIYISVFSETNPATVPKMEPVPRSLTSWNLTFAKPSSAAGRVLGPIERTKKGLCSIGCKQQNWDLMRFKQYTLWKISEWWRIVMGCNGARTNNNGPYIIKNNRDT